MIIAIPVYNGILSAHFGHCEKFALVEVDSETKQIIKTEYPDAPPHQPGLLPEWLHNKGASMVIAGGMGQRAIGMFSDKNITVITGAPSENPEKIVQAYLDGILTVGGNVCDH